MEGVKYDLGSTQRRESTQSLEAVVRKIVDERTKEISLVIHKIKECLKDETNELTDLEIDDILLQLPILLFDSMDEQEVVGIQSDMASQILKEAQSEAFKYARGTVQEKNAVVDLDTREEQLETIIYSRAYKMIKQKFETAIEVLNAVKRIQATRQQRYELGNSSLRR